MERLIEVAGFGGRHFHSWLFYWKAIKEAKESSRELRKVVQDAEAKLPVFVGMKSKIEDVFERVNHLLPGESVDLAKQEYAFGAGEAGDPLFWVTIYLTDRYFCAIVSP